MATSTPKPGLYGIPIAQWGATAQQVKVRLDYASYVSHAHKYVYIETPKVACTRVKMLIHRLENLPPVKPVLNGPAQSKPYMYIHVRQAFKMPSLVQLPESEASSILHDNDWFKFCFVRNPYSRLVSVWRNKIRLVEPRYEAMYRRALELYPDEFEGRFLTFAGFVRFLCDDRNQDFSNPHWALQTSLLFPQAIRYNFTGRIEDFDAGIETIEQAIGISFNATHRQQALNASAPADWRSYYDNTLARKVFNLYKRDFDTYSYDRDSWQGGEPLPARPPNEVFLEEEIFERNRMINLLAQALKGSN